MKISHILIWVGAAVGFAPPSLAYPTSTHAAMTGYVVARSRLQTDPTLLEQLGIKELIAAGDAAAPFNFGVEGLNYYAAISRTETYPKKGNGNFEQKILDAVQDAIPASPADHSIAGWIMRGVIREDDNPIETLATDPGSDEEGGVFARVYGHFFDPLNDHGLRVFDVQAPFPKTTDWLLQPGARIILRENMYSLNSAHEAMWRALTGVTREGVDAKPAVSSSKQDTRKLYWATTFRDLGDAVHLLQDMAQPQHTRIDAHSGLGCVTASVCLAGHDSFYEKYMDARTLEKVSFRLQEGLLEASNGPAQKIKQPQLQYGGYGAPAFADFTSYFTTGNGFASLEGKGLANYSNRGFYTFGTNIGSTLAYPLPNPLGLGLRSEVMMDAKDMNGEPLGESLNFLVGEVPDFLTNSQAQNIKLSTQSSWSQFMRTKAIWSLNNYNYDDQAKLLVPRAVGYSVGLIDHFFRGKLEITPPKEGVYAAIDMSLPESHAKDVGGFGKLKLRIQNMTPDVNGIAATDRTGVLIAVVRFHRNKCYQRDLSGEYGSPGMSREICRDVEEDLVASKMILSPAGMDSAPQDVTFDFEDRIPINATDVYLQVVYRGRLGADEEAIAVASKDISEPAYIGAFDTLEQYYWPAGSTDTFADFCAKDTPPMPYLECRQKYSSSTYFRFSPPENFDSANPVASFKPMLSFPWKLVSQFSRAAILADLGETTTYTLRMKPTDTVGAYVASTSTVVVNQVDSSTDSGPPLEYKKVRGIFANPATYNDLTQGDVPNPPEFAPIHPIMGSVDF